MLPATNTPHRGRQGGAGAVIEVDYVGGGCTSGLAIRRVRWLVLMGAADPEWRPAPDATGGRVLYAGAACRE